MAILKEYDIPFEGTRIHCWEGGEGIPVILLHGSGAGVSIHSNFKRVIEPLARKYHVLAADLVGFGKSGLKPAEPFYDMGMWVRQAASLINHFDGEPTILIGHSLSGSIVLKAAAHHGVRVRGVITTGTMGAPPVPGLSSPRWRFPDGREAIRAAVERTFYDTSWATEDEVDWRLSVLTQPGYKDYFEKMFSLDPGRYIAEATVTVEELAAITCPVILMHGIQDRSFRPEDASLALARAIENARAIVINRCAHSVAVEHADIFLAAVDELAVQTKKS